MQLGGSVKAAGDSHPGLQRSVNEDRFHCDAAHGIFIVVDGVGGQAAGEQAAETALTTGRTRLAREQGAGGGAGGGGGGAARRPRAGAAPRAGGGGGPRGGPGSEKRSRSPTTK